MHNLIIKFRRKLLYYRLKYYIKRQENIYTNSHTLVYPQDIRNNYFMEVKKNK